MSDALDLFDQITHTGSLGSDKGEGRLGWWPRPGTHDNALIDITVKPSTFTWKNPQPGGSFSCVDVQAHYQLLEDPESPDGTPRSWEGRPIALISTSDYNRLPTNQQQRCDIEARRFNAFVEVVTGMDPTSTTARAAMESLQSKAKAATAAGTPIACKVRIDWSEGKGGVSFPDKEYIQELLHSL